ncbi:lipopolysaccharide transport periplasmic protein LptA [Dokdonella fugitiva]|jgi:lipopolysaccharide export system protein LptA|uniref:Lipopolysaccharide export system protein LptA n=1 Tax=Dokdonella fugitiva TaxID=328517 RepID=A0A4R2IEU9_9GAMM|nr:lipopolysaccharide transport periplasmic protein LptA [Dokdonella fugitiva]MBA8885060.1 lipopolysaccharide export system protein LptA [Dokdonella fugitiva]TCO42158.1 lipopolysaccharide export system protein LptA [Dokdonella fugitiva]
MSVRPCNRGTRATARNDHLRRLCAALLACAALPAAHALGTDRDKPMDVTADYSKINQGRDKQPGTTYLRGNVRVVQGTMKASAAEATIHQKSNGDVLRVVMKGKQAHVEQQQDGGGTMTADADQIDFDNQTSIAVLTGNVKVVQSGRGEFHGEKMTYNTNTGEMESGDASGSSRAHIILQPKAKSGAAKPADAQPEAKPAGEPGAPL